MDPDLRRDDDVCEAQFSPCSSRRDDGVRGLVSLMSKRGGTEGDGVSVQWIPKRKTPPGGPAVFPNGLKGRKGEKETAILNFTGAHSPEERECRRESESLDPTEAVASGHRGLFPLTNRNIIHINQFVK